MKTKQITQIALVVVSAGILIALSACGQVEATNDSQHVTQTASKIADFEPPAGFAPELSAEMGGYTFASYKGETGPSHLYLIQSQKESDGEELARALAQVAPGSSDPNTRMTVVDNRTVTVRGQNVAVVISEGVNSNGVQYRQATAGFRGKGGPAMLVLSDSPDRWDQAAVDAFLQSIR